MSRLLLSSLDLPVNALMIEPEISLAEKIGCHLVCQKRATGKANRTMLANLLQALLHTFSLTCNSRDGRYS